MLKATIFTTICGLLLARIRWPYALTGIALVTVAEIAHLILHKQHSLAHFALDFGALEAIGQLTWLLGAVWLVRTPR